MLTLKLFGSGEASIHDQPIKGFPHQQAFLLFCYLLLNRGRPHFREQLAAVFWSDYPSLTARKYLRNSLYRLKDVLDSSGLDSRQYLSVTEESLAFINTSDYWLDVECFETVTAHYHRYRATELLPDHVLELQKSVDLYTGDLLEGVYEDWCLHDRERLRMAYLSALEKLMLFCAYHGNYGHGIEYGEQILSLDPTSEIVHRQIMVLYWLVGDRCSALAQYKRCQQILMEEMGMAPVKETQLLYEKMIHNQFMPGSQAEEIKFHPIEEQPALRANNDLELIKRHLDELQEKSAQVSNEIQHLQILIEGMLARRTG